MFTDWIENRRLVQRLNAEMEEARARVDAEFPPTKEMISSVRGMRGVRAFFGRGLSPMAIESKYKPDQEALTRASLCKPTVWSSLGIGMGFPEEPITKAAYHPTQRDRSDMAKLTGLLAMPLFKWLA